MPQILIGILTPRLKYWMPNPSVLADLDKAAGRIADAIQSGESCAVFGDYDVDGGASSALLAKYFRALGQNIRIYVPDRMQEGYGPNAPALQRLAGEGVTLVITVDCGAQAFDAFRSARRAGLDVVVADHHMMDDRSPDAFAIVNPNRPADSSGLGHLCAAGVTFMLLAGVNRVLRTRNWFTAGSVQEPDLRSYLDLVALATVCDVVPLTGLNRAFVRQGLKILEHGSNIGLAALRQVSGLKGALRASHFGFALGPRVNAGGRVGQADLGALLLSSDDPVFSAEAAGTLNFFNEQRQAIEAHVLQEALEKASSNERLGIVAVASEGWHPGVVGIVAGRLKDKFDLPSAVFALDGDIARASLRSVAGVDIGGAVAAAKEAGLLTSGGGHKMAAALSAPRRRLDEIIECLDSFLRPQVADRVDRGRLNVDALLGPKAFTADFFESIERAGPFGSGNPEPVFAVPDARIVHSSIVGTNHVSVVAQCGESRLKAIAFRAAGEPLGRGLVERGAVVHLAGRLLMNEWQGQKRVELSIEDAAFSGTGG